MPFACVPPFLAFSSAPSPFYAPLPAFPLFHWTILDQVRDMLSGVGPRLRVVFESRCRIKVIWYFSSFILLTNALALYPRERTFDLSSETQSFYCFGQ